MNEETLRPVVQAFPEEYQGMITAVVIAAFGAWGFYNIAIKPLMAKSTTNKMLISANERILKLEEMLVKNGENLNVMVNETLSIADKANISKNIIDLEMKLPIADDETKIIIQAEIDRQKALLNA
jgi:hypothetical protein